MKQLCKTCGHERKYHAIAENHILGTTHCTYEWKCQCKEFVEDD